MEFEYPLFYPTDADGNLLRRVDPGLVMSPEAQETGGSPIVMLFADEETACRALEEKFQAVQQVNNAFELLELLQQCYDAHADMVQFNFAQNSDGTWNMRAQRITTIIEGLKD